MSTFDIKAKEWDKNPMHLKRSEAIAASLIDNIALNPNWKALEFGAGTGLLSFLLKNKLGEITLVDNSQEMINVCKEKCEYFNAKHIHPIFNNLEKDELADRFDLIYSQMALHHVKDVKSILKKLFALLNVGGSIAIADLYTEDGSFHGEDEDVHKGFDPQELSNVLASIGYKSISYSPCYSLERENGISYPIFLIVAKKE